MESNRAQMPLNRLIDEIMNQQKAAGFSAGTMTNYQRIFNRLKRLADSMGINTYIPELADNFISDTGYQRDGSYCHSRFLLHTRCIQFIETYIRDGIVDWSMPQHGVNFPLQLVIFQNALDQYHDNLIAEGLKPNTVAGYCRFVFYFLQYLENKGYTDFNQVMPGDITFFNVLVCQEHYEPTSLGSCMPGLRKFIQQNEVLKVFEGELPIHIRKKVPITPTYTDEELNKITAFLNSGDISARNKAIALIAFGTGLRAVDICELKLEDIDWIHDVINITQEKTGKPLNIPVFPELGNALTAYLLEERPDSDSPYVFLSWNAPFHPLRDHSGIYNILRQILSETGVDPNGRISGTRMTRHSYASRLLRKGVPLPVISQALGHSSPNSSIRYISTDEKTMASLTLPLPKENDNHDGHL